MEWLHRGNPTTLGAASGTIAGLATITPAAGFVGPNAAIAIGLLAGLCCYGAVAAKTKLGYDDSLDVVGIHGVGGIVGTLCVGIFASTIINPGGADGLLSGGGFRLLGNQFLGVLVVGVYAFVLSWILLKIVDSIMGLRVSEETEMQGLDLSEHVETAYGS